MKQTTPKEIKEMAARVGLSLDDQRAQVLCAWIDQVAANYASLDQVELGETPPAFAFKCRSTDAQP